MSSGSAAPLSLDWTWCAGILTWTWLPEQPLRFWTLTAFPEGERRRR